MKGRVEHIDIAKGISITLVAMFHSKLRVYFPETIDSMSLFRMPLFFLLSGIFFSWSDSPKGFLLKKSEALLKPYFSVLLMLFLTSVIAGEQNLLSQLGGIFYGNADTIRWFPMWFLTHLFAVYVFSYVLFRYSFLSNLRPFSIVSVMVLFLAVGTVWIDYFWNKEIGLFSISSTLPGLPFSLDIVLISSAYFILGHTLKKYLINFTPNLWILSSCTAVFLLITKSTIAHIDLSYRVYDAPLYATVGALCGIYIIIAISYFIAQKHWLSFIPSQLG